MLIKKKGVINFIDSRFASKPNDIMNMNEVNQIYGGILMENGEKDEDLSKNYKKHLKHLLQDIIVHDFGFLLRSAQNCKKCSFLDNLRTIKQAENMEIRQMILFFSSTFSTLTVCTIHFCI